MLLTKKRDHLAFPGIARLCFLSSLLALLFLPRVASAAALVVTNTNDSGEGSLRAAILSADSQTPPATITFSAGLTGVILLQSPEPDITASMTLQGPGADTLAVDGSGKFRVFHVTAGQVSMSGLTIQHGYYDAGSSQNYAGGGGIQNENGATLTLTACLFRANNAYYGGVLLNFGTAIITDCTFSGNSANISYGTQNLGSGGAIWNAIYSSVTMLRCTLTGNAAAQSGGGIFNGGDLTLTDCDLTVNSAGEFAGAIEGGNLTMTGCLLVGNGAGVGGAIAVGASTEITGCTFTANGAGDGGAIFAGGGTVNLTDDILYSDLSQGNRADSNEIFLDNNAIAKCDHCDIAGGVDGPGNLDADPQFVRLPAVSRSPRDYGDLHLLPTSPCIGAGVFEAVNTEDYAGNLRPVPPAIGAYDLPAPAVPASSTHLLWTNTNGTAAVWNESATNGTFTSLNFGPYPGWTAKAIADGGTDGKTRLLWTNTNGKAALWNVAPSTGAFTANEYGPYSGWTARAVSVGGDNTTHLLWTNTSGKVALWNVVGGAYQTEQDFGPYPDWTAQSIAEGGTDGKTRLLWTNTDGRAAFWNVTPSMGAFTANEYGPYAGWNAKGISVSATTTHILWSKSDGTAAVWNYTPSTGGFTSQNYGPYNGWTANALADGSDGQVRLLWNNVSGAAAPWSLDSATGVFRQFGFGPYSDWSAVSVSAP